MNRSLQLRSRGFSLPELMVAVIISGFLTSFLGFLTFMVMRNTAIVHEQVLAQSSASTAAERVVAELRDAKRFARFTESTTATMTQLRYVVPSGTTETIHSLDYDSESKKLNLYANADATGDPKASFPLISDFEVLWMNEFRVRLKLRFQYTGFAFYFDRPNHQLLGQFVTEVIARNHFIDEGSDNYADPNTTGPRSL